VDNFATPAARLTSARLGMKKVAVLRKPLDYLKDSLQAVSQHNTLTSFQKATKTTNPHSGD